MDLRGNVNNLRNDQPAGTKHPALQIACGQGPPSLLKQCQQVKVKGVI
jgi:hypothetical protein